MAPWESNDDSSHIYLEMTRFNENYCTDEVLDQQKPLMS